MAINIDDMIRIRARLVTAWKDVMPNAAAVSVWLDTFKMYDYETIEKACIDYMRTGRFKPTPADILMCIPAKRVDEDKAKPFAPMYVNTPDGRNVRAIRCKRCRDTGLIVWETDDYCMVGRPCTCEAAIANYGKATRAKAYKGDT